MLSRLNQTDAAAARGIAVDAAVALVALLVVGGLGLHNPSDWRVEARPAVDALLGGHVHSFLGLAPVYGPSLLLRAPFFLATQLWHAGGLALFRASAVPCLLAIGALAVFLSAQMRAKGSSTPARLVVLGLCVANPLSLSALKWGHPEDLLSAALCIGAVLCALRDRTIWSAVALGLAIANKEWAVLAVGPVLLALPRARVRTLIIAAGVTGGLMAPFLLGATGFVAQAKAAGTSTGTIFHPWQIWWFLGSYPHVISRLQALHPELIYRIAPTWVSGIGHTLVVALMVPLSGLFALLRRHRRGEARDDVLLLLALLLALRCLLDPWDISYYALPFLLALLTWEVSRSTGAPVVTVVATLVTSFILKQTGSPLLHLSRDAQAAIFLLVSVPSIAGLAVAAYVPQVGEGLLARSQRLLAAAAPAPAPS